MPKVGGVETIMDALARGFVAWPGTHPGEDIEVTLVTQTPAANMDDSRLPFLVVRKPGVRRLAELIHSADLVHLAGPAFLPLVLARLFDKPTVLEHHNYQSICPNGLLLFQPDLSVCPGHFMAGRYGKCLRCNSASHGWLKSALSLALAFPRRWLASMVTANVTPSLHMASRAALPRTQVIYHGVPLVISEATRNETGNRPCFGFVGRLVHEKGVALLIQAAAALAATGHEFRVKIVGDGPERQNLEGLAAMLNLQEKTEFLGSLPPAEIANVLDDACAVVMPSMWEDVAPLVAIEQMIQGRLLIVSDVGGLGETVNGFGLRFPMADVGALTQRMQWVIENPKAAREMALAAQANARSAFAQGRMIGEHVLLYDHLLGHGTR